ncbi:MAG TPA: HD domain-containing protein [Burkholderiaceae bacterium]|nr:HD domain-containing protein [Burkholderiaceae bacterium]
MRDLVNRADAFAAMAHGLMNQRRKYTGRPYVEHPRAVAALVRTVPHTEKMLAGALLHDVVEDTPLGLLDIQVEFGVDVARLVLEVTDQAPRSLPNRAARKTWEAQRLATVSAPAKTIKLADVIDNVDSIVEHDPSFARVYLKENEAILCALEGGDETLLRRAWIAVENGWRTLCV